MTGGAAGLVRAGVDLLDRQGEVTQGQPAQRARQAPRLAREAPAQPTEQPQPRLSGLDPADRLASDDDLLDIPAFLRRQAN